MRALCRSARALAGAFVLLALGVLAAPMAQAQTTPAVPGFTVTPVAGSTDKLDVSWGVVAGTAAYRVQWKTAGQEYALNQRVRSVTGLSFQIPGLTAGTAYTVRVSAVAQGGTVLARSEASATTNVPTLPLSQRPIATVVAGDPVAEGTPATFTVKLCADEPGHRYDPRGDTCIPKAAPMGGLIVNFTTSWSKYGPSRKPKANRVPRGVFYDPDKWETYFPETVNVAAGAKTATITIPTHDDSADEPNGWVSVALGNGARYQTCPYTITACSDRVAVTDNDPAGAPPGGDQDPSGVGTAALTGLTVSPVTGEPTRLVVSWDAVQSATTYHVRWKTGAGVYGNAVETTGTSYTVTGLTAGTAYTVNVAALDGSNTLLAEAAAPGTTEPRAELSTVAPTEELGATGQAESSVLVTNTGETRYSYLGLGLYDLAQAFTTGSNTDGYTLTSVEPILRGFAANTASAGLTVSINRDTNGAPGTSLGALTVPGTLSNGVTAFTHTGLALEPSTTYWVVFDATPAAFSRANGFRATQSHDQSGMAGWTLGDGVLTRSTGSATWGAQLFNLPLLLDVKGTAKGTGLQTGDHLSGELALTAYDAGKTGGGTIGVSWTPATQTGVTGYLVQWKSGDQSYSTSERNHTTEASDSSYFIGSLALGTYDIRVTQQGGTGADTAIDGTMTLQVLPNVLYVDPVAGDAEALDVEWDAVDDAAGYVIQWKLASVSAYPDANTATVTVANLQTNTYTRVKSYERKNPDVPAVSETLMDPMHRITGLQPNTDYIVKVTAYTASGSATSPDGDPQEGSGATHGALATLSAEGDAGDSTKLNVTWVKPTISGARRFHVNGYRIQWKTGTEEYSLTARHATATVDATSHEITGLTAGTDYTVKVTVLGKLGGATPVGTTLRSWTSNVVEDGDADEVTATTSGVTGGSRGEARTGRAARAEALPGAPRFVIYHDPTAGPAGMSRYTQATTLLANAGVASREVTGDVQAEASRLAGVTNSVMPRFFFGDPHAPGWTPRPKVNNGGLRWLKAHVANLPGLSVADVRVTEAPGATLDFTVTLDTAATGPVTVAYATVDGTATAGADYTATRGTLRFHAGETSKTISVPVLDDAHDEGTETLTFRLSTAAGARLADGTATGTIANTDPLPQAWLARFGRTVGTHVTDAISTRLRGGPEASSLTIGGQPVPLRPAATAEADAAADDGSSALLQGVARLFGLGPGGTTGDAARRDPRLDQGQTPSFNLRQVLLGSAFRLNLGAGAGGTASPRLTAWGRVAGTRFDGQDSTLTLDGDVLTGTVGLDSTWDRLLLGLAVAHSRGNGAFTQTGPRTGAGTLEQTLTSLHPYLRYAVTDQLDVWGTVGYGWGALTLEQDDQARLKPDTTLLMGAIGSRGILLNPAESGGYQLATRADAMFTRMTSDAVTGLAGADGNAHRLRLILEGSRTVAFAEGRHLTPTLELGLRHDWGDAETGFGLEVGGRVQYVDPTLGLTVEGAVRGLVAHEDSAYNEWGASGTIRVAPGAGGAGLALTLAPSWGATASGVEDLWSRQTTAGLAPGIGPAQTGRLTAEVGYGFAAFARGLLTPYAGTSLADGQTRTYRLGTRWQGTAGLTLSLEGTQQDALGAQPMNQGFRLQAEWGF